MSRVNHAQIKKLISQKRETIRDNNLFVSAAMTAHLEDIVAAQTKRYDFSRRIRVKIVWQPKNLKLLAVTNNDLVLINAGHPIITRHKSRTERYMFIMGLLTHELGHILFTDFVMMQTYILKFQAGNWYPEVPKLSTPAEKDYETDLWYYLQQDEKKKQALVMMAHDIFNCLEDGYVESRMLYRYSGKLGMALSFIRDIQKEECPDLTQMLQEEKDGQRHPWHTIMQLILSYMLWGELKYGAEPLTDERVQMVFSLLPELDGAITEHDARARWRAVNTILIRCWPYIKDYLQNTKDEQQDSEQQDGNSNFLSQLTGSSQKGTGTSKPVDEPDGSSSIQPSNIKSRQTTARLAAGQQNSANNSPTSDDGDDSSQTVSMNAEVDTENSTGSGSQGDDNNALGPENTTNVEPEETKAKEVVSKEGGRIPLKETEIAELPSGAETFQYDSEYMGSGYASAAADIERVVEQMAEKSVHQQLEKERTAELNVVANGISYGDIHSGVPKIVKRIANVSEEVKAEYKKVAPSLLKISKRLQQSILQQLQERRRGGKMVNLYSGRKLYIHALPRNDGRIFLKKKLPNETPEIAVGLLLDESGSMSWGDRASYARATAIILYDFCRSLNIPIMIYGHTALNEVSLYSYAEFDDIDGNDKYRLMDISARDSNRDGAALIFAMNQLAKRSEEVRLLILVSDGQPNHDNYYGTAAEDDLRSIKKQCERKKILLLTAAIGDDKKNIERIYGNSFMDITDLERLPDKLTQAIKRHLSA